MSDSPYYAEIFREKKVRRSGVKPFKPPFEFTEIRPLVLKNQVSGKVNSGSVPPCLHEMSIVFACLKKFEFDQTKCPKEITDFETCSKAQHEMRLKKTKGESSAALVPGRPIDNPKQLNALLKKFPHILKKI